MAQNPVCWFETYVQDMPRAKAFYEAVLGVQLALIDSPGLEMWGFPQTMEGYGSGGALVKMEGVESGGNSTLVYYSCEDCGVEAGRVAAAGGKVVKEKFAIGQYGAIALAQDTEGNLFGLHSMQ